MKLRLLIQMFIGITFMVSCNPKLTKSLNYKTAIKELAYHDFADNYILIPKDELKSRRYFSYNLDTIFIDKSIRTFGFRNTKNSNIYVYQFSRDGSYKRVKCDSVWNVYEISEYVGGVYKSKK
jgi:hypothetical protein